MNICLSGHPGIYVVWQQKLIKFDKTRKITMKYIIHTDKYTFQNVKYMKICARKSQKMHFRASRPLWLLGPLSGPQTPGRKSARSMSDRIERAAFDYQDTLSAPNPNLDTLLSKSWLSPWARPLTQSS